MHSKLQVVLGDALPPAMHIALVYISTFHPKLEKIYDELFTSFRAAFASK